MDAQLNVRSAFSSHVLRYVVCSSHVTHIVVVIVSRDSCLKACIEFEIEYETGLGLFWTNGLFCRQLFGEWYETGIDGSWRQE
jgi:hypothetical protein